MKIVLAIVAFLTALVAIRGETWNENARGLAKLTVVGRVAVVLAVASVGLTVAIESEDRGDKEIAKGERESKRLDAKSLLVREAYEIELMVSALEVEQSSEETLARLKLYVSRFKTALSLEGGYLGREDKIRATEFLQFAKTELAEMEFGESLVNKLTADELARSARGLRIDYCWELMAGSSFCRFIQGNPTANAFVEAEGDRMIEAMKEAKASLPTIVENLHRLSKKGVELQIKAAIPTGESREHIWLTDTTYENQKFHGIIGNHPNKACFLSVGDSYSVSMKNVSDWIFIDNGQLYGGYTLRVTRSRMTAIERSEFDRQMRFTIPKSPLMPSWQ